MGEGEREALDVLGIGALVYIVYRVYRSHSYTV